MIVNGIGCDMVDGPLTQEEKLAVFRRQLEYRQRGRPWYELARGLDEAMRGAAALGYGSDVIKRMAEQVTGLSPGLVMRYVSTYRRVGVAAKAAGVAPEFLLAPGFNPVEMAVRLYDRSPEAGLEALKALAEGRIGSSELRQKLSEAVAADRSLAASRSRTHRSRALELRAIQRALEGARGSLFPTDSLFVRRPPLAYFRRDGMEVRGADGACMCGLDLFVSADENAIASFEASLPSAFLLSLYFPRTFFVFSPQAPDSAVHRAIAAIDLFLAPWIGVLRITPELAIVTVRAGVGRPDPDRHDGYEALRSELSLSDRGTAADESSSTDE
ncbi:hypothetical protein AS156_18120 [Bradyrhizobium macuxiense]|uniref:Uncharacterized protein n=1 Tax=Bradyrhizobium macuxiense TaxID=1755647 RepID=A0A109JGH4_9BRAD|nr:hypothetical protein [Bradyrhizobium macuxiense]KWV48399.1 hypothetical protein AS156_18120 [Bradyrhizobium macuxiense]